MAQKKYDKVPIRNSIISAAIAYRDELAGKVFLYIVGDFSFEVVFKTSSFKHLTGVSSTLKAEDFYDKSKTSHLSTGQFYFDSTHPYRTAVKKLDCLIKLPRLTNSLVCVAQDMKTLTLTYKIGITDLNFTIGLTENVDNKGNKINDWFIPRTLRVKDKVISESKNVEFVDFIFRKDATVDKYTDLTYCEKGKNFPILFRERLSPDLLNQFDLICAE